MIRQVCSTIGLSVLLGSALAGVPNLQGKHVLLNSAPSADKLASTVEFATPARENLLNSGYALYVELAPGSPRPFARLNGTHFDTPPVPSGSDAYCLVLPTAYFTPDGTNQLIVESEKGAPLAATRLIVFELADGAEQAHFGRLFGERPAEKSAPAAHSSQSKYDVLDYELDLDASMTSRALSGSVTTTLKSLVSGLTVIAFDFQPGTTMSVSSVAAVPPIAGLTFSVDSVNNWLIVTLPGANALNVNDQITLKTTYSGTPTNSAGAFGLNSYNRTTQPTNGNPIVYTFSEPYSARSWWPCKDDPSDKATVSVAVTVDNPNTVVSNGHLVSSTPNGVGRTKFSWDFPYQIPTYLVAYCATQYAFASANYTALDHVTQMPVGHYVYLNSTGELAAVPDTIDTMEYYASKFGEYPFLTEKYVTMTWGGSFGMEHSTCTSINNGNLASGGKSRRNVHELAHQWFGDCVTPVNFDHIWLNEGWATYCEALMVEKDDGFADYKDYVQSWITTGINNTTPVVNTNADAFSNPLVYRKGGMVLHMLRHVVGDTAFFNGTKQYLSDHAYGVVDTSMFQQSIEDASGKDLDPFFQSWIYGTSLPNYQWGWAVNGNSLDVSITQTQTAAAFQMPVDIVATLADTTKRTFVANNTQKATQNFTFDVTGLNIVSVAFDPDYWIYKTGTTLVSTEAPKPTLLSAVAGATAGQLVVTWSSGGTPTNGFELSVASTIDGTNVVAGNSTLGASATTYTVTGLNASTTWYVKLRATATAGIPSDYSDVYAVRLGSAGVPRALLVDGNDRYEASQNVGASQNFAAIHGAALGNATAYFDACANEAVDAGVNLGDYDAVIYALGEESTVDRTFTAGEETLMRAYLTGGGQLFVNGAEIGWDIGRTASPNDSLEFYNDYLKATYVSDDSNDYTVDGVSGSIFAGLSFPYGTTGVAPYVPGFPDVLGASGGSTACLNYNGTAIAGVQYSGVFGAGSTSGKLVNFGFPFEVIDNAADRDAVMAAIVDFFGLEAPPPSGTDWMIY